MTTTSAVIGSTPDTDIARRATVPAAVAALVVTIALTVADANSMGERITMTALQLVVGALLFGLVVPRALGHQSSGGRGIAMGVVGLLLVVPAFWSGLPMLLGAAAALVGYAGKSAATGSGKARASLVLGLLAVIGYVAIYVLDYLSTAGAI
jgi:hypothetical protein